MKLQKILAVFSLVTFLCFCASPMPSALSAEGENNVKIMVSLTLRPGKVVDAPEGQVVSSDENVLLVEAGMLRAVQNGTCTLTVTREGNTFLYPVTVDDNVPPDIIQKAIEIAQSEWVRLDGHAIKKSNKYTLWYCGRPCTFGWCGGFASWCLDQAEVPMYRVEKAEPVPDGQPYGISEAGVGKLLKGYTKMERLSAIPRPGYLVIYGVRDRVNKTVHIGMVTEVEPMENGVYLITTVEGNVSNTVKSYQYYYDSLADPQNNISALPKDMWVNEKMSYKLHAKDWYINTFCQTYQ